MYIVCVGRSVAVSFVNYTAHNTTYHSGDASRTTCSTSLLYDTHRHTHSQAVTVHNITYDV